MREVEELLVASGVLAFVAAFIAALFPTYEGVRQAPQCSDCVFKVTQGYVQQLEHSAVLYVAGRPAAKFGWAYLGERPLAVGEVVACSPMYILSRGGLIYISCG